MNITQIVEDIKNIENSVNKIGNYSGCYPQKVEILNGLKKLRNDLNIPKENVRQMTKEEIEKELGYKFNIIG